jgi:intein-encoded DNA endonuclease-like protein
LSSAPIGRILFLCGTPQGNKVLNPTKIPEWILKNKMYFRRFIQRLFDCEATVDKNYRAIGISMAKSDDLMENGLEFFNQLKYYLFKYYKIITSKPFTESKINKRKDDIKTRQIRLKIRRRKSLEIFCKRIGFENETKQHKLILSLKDIGTPGRGGN